MLISLQQWLPAIILISKCSAFYPYHQPSPSSLDARTPHNQPRNHDSKSLRLPLQKLPTKSKRTNTFSIVSASIPHQTDSLAVDQDGGDLSYISTFTVGSSQTPYHLLLDSAASNTWIMSRSCVSQTCEVHNTLDSSDSTSLKINAAQSFAVTYGTGSVSGDVATDTLHSTAFSVPLTFGLATNVSDEFASYPMDGILGFGRSNLVTQTQNNINAPTLIDVLVSQNVITHKLFGIHLWRSSSGSPNNGEINLGAPDTSMYSGQLNYLAALDNIDGFWEIPVDDAGVDGKSAGLSGNTAVVDTGTSFILMPQAHAAKLHALIPGSANPGGGETFTVPCNAANTVQFTFGGTVYSVLPADYVGGNAGGTNTCYSNIVGRQTFNATQWLMGDVFLKNVYTVFDFDGQRMGFGTLPGDGDGAATSSTSGAPPATTSKDLWGWSPNGTNSMLFPTATSTGKGSASGSATGTATANASAGSHANAAPKGGTFEGYKLAWALLIGFILQWSR